MNITRESCSEEETERFAAELAREVPGGPSYGSRGISAPERRPLRAGLRADSALRSR